MTTKGQYTLQCGRALRVWFKKSQPKNEGPIIEKEEEEKDEAISVPAAIKKKRRSKCEATEEVQPTWTFSAQKKNRGCASIEQLIAQPCPYCGAEEQKYRCRSRPQQKERARREKSKREKFPVATPEKHGEAESKSPRLRLKGPSVQLQRATRAAFLPAEDEQRVCTQQKIKKEVKKDGGSPIVESRVREREK